MKPLIHTRTFRVRFYECDAYGHVNNTNYLRYILETNAETSTAPGSIQAVLAGHENQWLMRAADIEYLTPLRYGDTVSIKTRLSDIQDTLIHQDYELRSVLSNELVARVHTEWELVNRQSEEPMPIPPEVVNAFFPDGVPSTSFPRKGFPSSPPPPDGVFSIRRRVNWADIDPTERVNPAAYLAYIEECGIQVAAAFGWPMPRWKEAGFSIVARRHRIQYRHLAALDEELEVSTWLSDIRRATAYRHYTIRRRRDGVLLARARTYWVWIDAGTGRPIRVPKYFLEDFMVNIAY